MKPIKTRIKKGIRYRANTTCPDCGKTSRHYYMPKNVGVHVDIKVCNNCINKVVTDFKKLIIQPTFHISLFEGV